jgi:hypothetical protein
MVNYNVDESNNIFSIKRYHQDPVIDPPSFGDFVSEREIVIPFGNYTTDTFLVELKKLLLAAGTIEAADKIKFYTENFMLKMELTPSAVNVLCDVFVITFEAPLAYLLFGGDVNGSSYTVTAASTYADNPKSILTFPYPMDMSGSNTILIRLNEGLNMHKTCNGISFFSQLGSGNSSAGEIVQYKNEFSNQSSIIVPDNLALDKIHVQLLDEYGYFYDLRGVNWTIIVQINEYYEYYPRHNDLTNYIDDTSYIKNGFNTIKRHRGNY